MKNITLLSCMLILSVACNHNKYSANKDPYLKLSGDTVIVPGNSPLLSKIRLQTIAEQEFSSCCTTTGTVKTLSGCLVSISTPFEGRVVRCLVKLGQKVTAGSPLFEVNSLAYFETVQVYMQADQELQLTDKNHHRKKDLFEAGVGSKKDFEEAESAYQVALKAKEKAGASLNIFNITPDEVKLGKPMVVRSPINGEIVKSNITVGQYLRTDDEPVMTVADLNRVWVVARIKENNIGSITEQDEVQVLTEAFPDHPVHGFVDYIGNIVDEQTRSVEVYVMCENQNKMLKPGMFATVRFLHTLQNTIVVPATAILQEENRCYLYTQSGKNKFVKRQVTIQTNGEKMAVVRSGLVAGDVIVTEGGVYLR
jgi:cobalt-zinc-cadmium efflux system membrane fusion protein